MSSNHADRDDDLAQLLAGLTTAYGDLTEAITTKLPDGLKEQIRDLGRQLEELMEIIDEEQTDPELDCEEIEDYNKMVLSDVNAIMIHIQELRSCVRQHTR